VLWNGLNFEVLLVKFDSGRKLLQAIREETFKHRILAATPIEVLFIVIMEPPDTKSQQPFFLPFRYSTKVARVAQGSNILGFMS
jgi:hypothetical protein